MRLIDEQIVMLMPSTKWVLPLFNAASLFNMMHTPVSFFLGGLFFFFAKLLCCIFKSNDCGLFYN